MGTNFSEIVIAITTFSFKKMHLKMSSGKWRPFVSASLCWLCHLCLTSSKLVRVTPYFPCQSLVPLTHWGRATHICVGKLTIIGSDNGLSPGQHQAIIWTNARILLIGPLGTNFSEILIGNEIFSFKKMHLKMSSAKWRPFYLSLNVLSENLITHWCQNQKQS